MADKRFTKSDWLYGTILSSAGKDTFIQHFALDDGLGAILGTSGNPLNVTGGGTPGGATAAKQDDQITQETLINARLGDITTPAAGSVNARLASVLAKQPALGTAGTPSADVISVQGVTSGTPLIIGGNVASGVADSGNPVKIGGVYNSTAPTLANGQRGDVQCNTRAEPIFQVTSTAITPSDAITNNAVGIATPGSPTAGRPLLTFPLLWDGAQHVRTKGDTTGQRTVPCALTGTDRSIGVTVTSQTLMAANTARKGFMIRNDTDTDVWVNFDGAAVAAAGSGNYKIAMNGGHLEPPAGLTGTSAITVIHGGSGTKNISAREW
jgi:hypothetical protein